MLGEVASFLNKRGKDGLIGKLVLVSDHIADGSFLIHHFISQALKDGHVVYVVSFAQSLIHYSSVAAKLGVNLSRFQTSGQLVFVDCLTRLLDLKWTESDDIITTPTTQTSTTITYTLDSNGSLCGLYKALQTSLSSRKTQEHVCLVLDDLSVLTSVGVRERDIHSFVKYCVELVTVTSSQPQGYVVAMVHCEGGREGGGEEGRLCSRLLCHAHLHLAVNGLETGYCRDIHGQITAEWRDPCPSPAFSLTTKEAQFKISDKTVQLFAKGTSKVVL